MSLSGQDKCSQQKHDCSSSYTSSRKTRVVLTAVLVIHVHLGVKQKLFIVRRRRNLYYAFVKKKKERKMKSSDIFR